jgi:hypothetical protein
VTTQPSLHSTPTRLTSCWHKGSDFRQSDVADTRHVRVRSHPRADDVPLAKFGEHANEQQPHLSGAVVLVVADRAGRAGVPVAEA